QLALIMSGHERLSGIGSEVHLPRNHLLHGQISRGHGELFELKTALFKRSRTEQVISRHSPDIGLVALADGNVLGKESGWSKHTRCDEAAAGMDQEFTPGQRPLFHGSPPFSTLDFRFWIFDCRRKRSRNRIRNFLCICFSPESKIGNLKSK